MEALLDGRTAVVTGSGRGIGKAIALKLASAGADVIVCDINEGDAAAASKEIESLGRKSMAVAVDVSDFQSVTDMVTSIYENFEQVDILVNNAGITRDKPLFLMAREDWEGVINVNLTGFFNVTRQFIMKFMKAKRGNVVNIASVSGLVGVPGQANYCASKAGIIGFSRAVAKETAKANIPVNCIAPGFIKTDMTAKLNEKQVEEALKLVPMKRMGTVDDVAELALYLASDKAAYITGQVFPVDGGMSC
ncbi:MAG: 3-oxoacyl-[acyl-carrier-protein] reductase [Chitinivibrionales bacterium]|nr:3-oxoacyl-[acyl-carrier-protein] reductase [Chitinivibrionales bacterium]MBD3395093.1 3-oxoacyl-[acyl-carrier-protein] reductase [Chitinivibrionales bacterium]